MEPKDSEVVWWMKGKAEVIPREKTNDPTPTSIYRPVTQRTAPNNLISLKNPPTATNKQPGRTDQPNPEILALPKCPREDLEIHCEDGDGGHDQHMSSIGRQVILRGKAGRWRLGGVGSSRVLGGWLGCKRGGGVRGLDGDSPFF